MLFARFAKISELEIIKKIGFLTVFFISQAGGFFVKVYLKVIVLKQNGSVCKKMLLEIEFGDSQIPPGEKSFLVSLSEFEF